MAKGLHFIRQILAQHSSRKQTHERFVPYFLVIFSFWLVCIVESIQQMGGQNLDPRFWMFLAILVTIYGGLNVFRLRSQGQNISSTAIGPQMNKVLDGIRENGFVTYHEPGKRGLDADYVVVGRGGIYVIEAKERNVFGSRTIDHRSENELVLGGKISDNQPLKQARAAAWTVHQHLQEQLHHQYPVKPLVVFPGDWRVNQPPTDFDVEVLTANELEDYLNRQQPRLTPQEIELICSHLEQPALAGTA